MADILELFKNLSKFYHHHLRLENIEKIYSKVDQNSEKSDIDLNEDSVSIENFEIYSDSESANVNKFRTNFFSNGMSRINSIEQIPIVQIAMKNPQVLSVLQELCTMIRNIRESNSGYDNTYDSWDRVIEISPKEKYFAFIFSLLCLVNHNPTSKLYRKLSMSVASLYILSLTIPGSKQYHIFDETMINYVLKIFHLISKIQEKDISSRIKQQDRVEIWINFVNLCDDLKIMFRYVHFDQFPEIRNSILWQLSKVMFNLHVNGYENIYAANLHNKCFEIYDEIINAHNGEPEDTLMKIMRINYCLHIFSPSSKRLKNLGSVGTSAQLCEHISDWFVNIISKYPRTVSKVLKHYIECVVTNPEKDWKSDQMQRALEYAAKYDSALYTKCNESILDFLKRATNAEDAQIRSNGIDLLIRILQIESKVNWELFRHEVSNISREIYIIKELIKRLLDVNNGIKLKILHGLHQAYISGTNDAVKIMTEGIRYAVFNDTEIELPQEPKARRHEIRYERPQQPEPAYSFNGHKIIEPYFSKLPNTIYHLLQSSSAHIRKAALLFLEPIVKINPLVIYNTNFVKEISKLGDDPAILVRKQAIIMIDSILGSYPNCYPVVFAWCKIIVPLFKDSDQKLVEFAWGCFKTKVFDNIKGIDSSNRAEHFMPWIILRVLLSSQQRQFLQYTINAAINKQIIDQKIIALIESHTLTANSTEAWTMLSFVAGKVKNKEPDSLISSFIQSMLACSWNAGQNLQIILEVLAICVQDFSHTALNMAFSCIITLMKNGNIPPYVISKAFNLCVTISTQSETKKTKSYSSSIMQVNHVKKSDEQLKWIEDIYHTAEKYLLKNLKNFHEDRSKILSYLFSYTETNLELVEQPNNKIVKFVHKFLEAYLESENPESDKFDPDDMNTLNLMIILAARFSIRQANVAEITCILFRGILKQTERPTTVNNVIVAMTDLCKRHTQLIENGINEILKKLQSPYVEIRLVVFKNLAQIVLQDLVKLRGNLLLGLMITLTDRHKEIANRATEFFFTFLEKKNPLLFHNCLLECPFVYNEYAYFDNFENFSSLNKKMTSSLAGEKNERYRQMLYKMFIYEEDDIMLLTYFENLKLIYTKIKEDPHINSKEGHAVINDILFILKEICIYSFKKKQMKDKQDQKEITDGVMKLTNNELSGFQKNDLANTISDSTVSGRGRRRNNGLNMNDALAIIEKNICLIPDIAEIILKWDIKFEKSIKNLSMAVCMRFENFTEFAQPDSFWSDYRQVAQKDNLSFSSVGRKRKIKNGENNYDGNDNGNNNEDDEMQILHRKKSRNTMSILFEPFLY